MRHLNLKFKLIPLAIVILLGFSLSSLVNPPAALACSCVPPGAPQEHLEKSAAVFSGKAIRVDSRVYGYEVRFDVERIWKGAAERTVTLSTGFGSGDCGYPFREGERYFVYANYGYGYAYGDTSLATNICQRTRLLYDADSDLAALGEGRSPTPLPDMSNQATQAIPTPMLTLAGALIVVVFGRIIYKFINRWPS